MRIREGVLKSTCLITIVAGILVIAGWAFDIALLKSILPSYPTMKFNTALGFVSLGVAFLHLITKRLNVFFYLFTALSFLIGSLSLAENIFDVQLGIDQLVFEDQRAIEEEHGPPGRPSSATSFCFVLLSIAFAGFKHGGRRTIVISQYMLHVVTLVAFLAILGYLYGTPTFYNLFFFYSVAVHTAFLFFILSIGSSFLNENAGITALFTGQRTGNSMIRFLFPRLLILIVTLGIIELQLYEYNILNVEFGTALHTGLFGLIVLGFLWINLRELNQLDEGRVLNETQILNLNKTLLVANKDLNDYKYALDSSSIVTITDEKGIIQHVNENFCRVAKYTKEEVIGKDHNIVNSGYHSKAFFGQLWATIKQGKIWKGEVRNRAKDGSIYWVDTSIVPFLNAAGKPVKYLAIRSVITERKKMEDQLRVREQRMRFLVENTPAGVAMFDNDMRYLMVSKRWLEDYRLGDQNVIGVSHYDLFPEISEQWKEFHRRGLTGEKLSSEGEAFPRADGTVEWVKWNLLPWYNDEGNIGGIVIFAELITERKLAEENLRSSEENYRSIYENTIVAMVTVDMNTFKLLMVNERATEVFGYKSKQDFIDRFDMSNHFISQEDQETTIEKLKQQGRLNIVLELRRLNGDRFWGKLFVKINSAKDMAQAVIVDITEQIQSGQKLAAKVKELQELNKELESFNFITSHDMQEPLRKIKNFSHLLLEETNLSEDGKFYLERMNETSYQMQALLEDLLAYSRVKNAARVFEHTDLREMLSAVLADFNERIKEKQAVVEIKGDLCSLDVIRYQFKQLLANIINNALKFADAGRAPIIKINSEVVNGKMLMIPQLSQECDYCHLTISDNGIGFDPKYNERIFEIFERLNAKDKYPGTGIGLAICKKIIEIHHGRIVAEGVLNKGANFHIYVPMR